MLFRKHVEPRCGYCRHGHAIDQGQVVCPKKGIMSEAAHCRGFRYDPLRRTPPRPLLVDFTKYDGKDYSL